MKINEERIGGTEKKPRAQRVGCYEVHTEKNYCNAEELLQDARQKPQENDSRSRDKFENLQLLMKLDMKFDKPLCNGIPTTSKSTSSSDWTAGS